MFIKTERTCKDLLLSNAAKKGLKETEKLISAKDTNLASAICCLFYGAPTSGKKTAASILGNLTNKPVYRVDTSLIVSKYIGETEKNLDKIFDKAHDKEWILFFDEADALFGKRSEVRDSNDRYANSETSYLLQKIEKHYGVVILAATSKKSIGKNLKSRFDKVIHFRLSEAEHK